MMSQKMKKVLAAFALVAIGVVSGQAPLVLSGATQATQVLMEEDK